MVTVGEIRGIRVLVADDHRMVRAGIRAMLSLSSTGVLCVVDEAETTEEVMEKAEAGRYDVILMDYNFPGRGGAKATELVLKRHPSLCVLGLSAYEERSYVERMVQAGARGYLLKNVEPDTLVTAIRSVLAGKPFYSNEIALKWMDARMRPQGLGPFERLTAREREVFSLVMAGLRDWEIAGRMFVSKRTVDKHRQNLMAKLGARNAVELVQAGVRMGMMG
jgi:DNA-binding NarL/FixJ family response regulator